MLDADAPRAPEVGTQSQSFRLPPQLEISSGNVPENFKKWRRQMQVYMAASGSAERSKPVQTAIILNCAGSHVLEIYDQMTWETEGDELDPEKVFTAIEKYCNPRENEVLESHRFWNLGYQEPFDKFLTELKTRASSCNFREAKDRMIRDKVVFTMTGKLQELLLREDNLTLEKAIKICRALEQSNRHVKEIRDIVKVNKVTSTSRKPQAQKGPPKYKQTWNTPAKKDSNFNFRKIECDYCGYKHEPGKQKCPAWGKTC